MTDLAAQLTALSSNQLLIAGVGTMLAAFAMMQAKNLFAVLKNFGSNQSVSTLTARSNGASIERLTQHVAKHRLHAWGRSYSVTEDNALTLGYGSGVARWDGVWIWYNLRVDENAKTYNIVEVLNLTFLTRDRGVISRFVHEALDASMLDRNSIEIHHRGAGAWRATTRVKRPLTTVFANAGMKTTLVEKLRWFLANEDWYVKRGLNYKLVILLHGPPGTGKSSLIQAIASEFNRDLYCVTSLLGLGPDIGRFKNGILAIEDIDTLGALNRSSQQDDAGDQDIGMSTGQAGGAKQSPKMLLHGVLNTLDGLATPHGLITVITTNHIDSLDPAMVRPCRIDLQLEVSALDYEAFVEMFTSYYDGALPSISPETYQPQTGARLQEIFMSSADSGEAEAAVRRACARVLKAA